MTQALYPGATVKNDNCLASENHHSSHEEWYVAPQRFIDSLVDAADDEIRAAKEEDDLMPLAGKICNLARQVYFYNPEGRWDSKLESRYYWYSEAARECVIERFCEHADRRRNKEVK